MCINTGTNPNAITPVYINGLDDGSPIYTNVKDISVSWGYPLTCSAGGIQDFDVFETTIISADVTTTEGLKEAMLLFEPRHFIFPFSNREA